MSAAASVEMPEPDAPSITEVDAPVPSLSYDFSKWNGADDTIREPENEPGPATFRVYTAQDIKDTPLRRAPAPPVDSGISNVADAIETAKSFGTGGIMARVGIGAIGAVLAVGVIAILATLADDTPAKSEAPAMTAAAIPMASPTIVVAAPAPAPAPVPAPAPALLDDSIELPATPDRPARVRVRVRPSAPSPSTTTKHIIRDNPY